MGNTNSLPGTNDSRLSIWPATPADEQIVLSIFRKSPEYFRRVDGCDVEPHLARREITETPKKTNSNYKKCFCVAALNGVHIGVADFHINHPEQGIAYLGLLLLDEEFHSQGIGRQVYEAAEKFIQSRFNSKLIRLGVSEDNDVEGFWKKMGFARNGHTYIWKGEKKNSNVFEMEKRLPENH